MKYLNTAAADDIRTSFHNSAELVNQWGRSLLPDRRTVEEALTISGIPFWSVISPTLAFGYISKILSRPAQNYLLKDYLRVLAQQTKRSIGDNVLPRLAYRKETAYPANKHNFLFLGFSPYIYRETLQPVATRLARRPDSSVTVIDDLFLRKAKTITTDGLMFHSVWQYWDADVARTRKKMCLELKNATHLLLAGQGLPAIVEDSGLSWQRVRAVLNWLLKVYLFQVVTQSAIALQIMKQQNISLLISPDVNDPRTRIFCLAGKLAGVKTLEIQFGFYGENDIEWRFFKADRLAVTGEANLEIMRGHGIPPEKMTITGSPRYDQALAWPQDLVKNMRSKLGVPADKVMFLFASQPYYYGSFASAEIRREMLSKLFSATAGMKKVILVVKPHPLEDAAELAEMTRGNKNILFADKLSDIRDLIKATDIFATFFSGTTFDSLVMNKPTINIAFPGSCGNNLFENCGATFVARNGDDILQILNLIDNGHSEEFFNKLSSARAHFLQQWFYRLDGQAAERIEALTLEMAS